MTCQYCHNDAVASCTRSTRKPVVIFPLEIRPGDKYPASDGRTYVVKSMRITTRSRVFPHFDWPMEDRQIVELSVERNGAPFVYFVDLQLLPVLIYRREPCGRPICDLHMRDLGSDTDFLCPEHSTAIDIEIEELRRETAAR